MPTIVVPLQDRRFDDGFSEAALPFAGGLAQRSGADLALISVVDVPRQYTVLTRMLGLPVDQEQDDRLVTERTAYLEGVAKGLGEPAPRLTVRFGVAPDEILGAVAGLDDPVVVMTSHGRAGLARHIVGSVAFHVVHGAPCPVVVLRPDGDPGAAASGPGGNVAVDRVVVPMTGSPEDERVLEAALAVLGPPDLALRLIHVVEPVRIDLGASAGRYQEAAGGWATTYLRGLAERLTARGYRADHEVRRGPAAAEIGAAAEAFGADLIAMAAHRRSGVGRMVLGSVTETVLRSAATPLMLLSPAARAGAEPTSEKGAD